MLVTGCGGSTGGEPSILRDVQCVREANGLTPEVWETAIEDYEAGYRLWTSIVRPRLAADLGF